MLAASRRSIKGRRHTEGDQYRMGAHSRAASHWWPLHWDLRPALTSPGGIPRHRRSTAGVFCPAYTWEEHGTLRKAGGPAEAPRPAPCTNLGQVPQHQHVPLGGPPDHAFPLPGHVLILLPQGGRQPQRGSEKRDVSEPDAGPRALPPSPGNNRPWQEAGAVLQQECEEEEEGPLYRHGHEVLADHLPAQG